MRLLHTFAATTDRNPHRSRGLRGAGLEWLIAITILCSTQIHAATLRSAGSDDFGQTTPPAFLTADPSLIATLDAGRDHSVALLSDGTVRAWGYSGDNRTTPPQGLTDLAAIDAGVFHTLAVRRNGTVTGWGFNGAGMLDVPSDLTNVVAVAAGGFHSLALRGDGIVVGWGFDGNGRTTAPASLTDVVAIDAGRDHSLALKSDGTVVAWGLNSDGQSQVPVGLKNVIAIDAGEYHNLALRSDGSVTAWGRNVSGQNSVPAGLANVVAIAAGGYHSLALRADGSVAAWGDNSRGQLSIANSSDVRSIAAGGLHSMSLGGRNIVFTSQPRSQTVIAGNEVSFVVNVVDQAGLTYQWRKNGQDIPGATGRELTLSDVTRSDAGIYNVTVHSASGSALSVDAILIVRGLHQLAPIEFLSPSSLRVSFGDRHGVALTPADLQRYRLESTTDFINWVPVSGAFQLMHGLIQVDITIAPNLPREFYRVVEP